jgi:hypothetical protein
MKLNIPLLLIFTLCCCAGFIGCGKVVDNNDDVRDNLISLTLETRSPDNLALGKKGSFLSPTDIIAQADNPKVAIIWMGMPLSDEWVLSNENLDTLFVTPDIKASWPLRISFNLKDPPEITANMKDHPESKVAVGFFVLFNDGNRNGRFDEYVQRFQGEEPFGITPFGPYDYFLPDHPSIKDTAVSPPMQSLTQQGKDWVIGLSVRHSIVWASDQRACDWLNRKFTYQEILDKDLVFETRFAALWNPPSLGEFLNSTSSAEPWQRSQLNMSLTDLVQFYDGIQTGYNLVNADTLTLFSDSITFTYDRSFDPITKQWKVWNNTNATLNYYITSKFSRIDQSTIIPVIITDDDEEFFKWSIWDG